MNASPHICEYKDNNSPLHLAIKINNKKIIDLLIENFADEEALNAHGKTPWQLLKLQNKCEKPDVELDPIQCIWIYDE